METVYMNDTLQTFMLAGWYNGMLAGWYNGMLAGWNNGSSLHE